MKKAYFFIILLIFSGIFVFGDTNEQEEIDFLLFYLNSSSRFVNEAEAAKQLDNMANYLKNRELISGQIIVHGYAANANNDIDPVKLSRDRALFVINELQRRGVAANLFSEPVGYGAVNLWGGNTNEQERIPNRRVIILIDGSIITPEIIMTEPVKEPEPIQPVIVPEPTAKKAPVKFPWWILLPLLLLLLLILLLARRKKPKAEPSTMPAKQTEVIEKPAPIPVPIAMEEKIVDLEEEIRLCAYGYFVERNYQHGF
ncbi:MAG: OmpA family protein, partial [Treponema sp.]|nr:OmpA family protein [Treponema sp.]